MEPYIHCATYRNNAEDSIRKKISLYAFRKIKKKYNTIFFLIKNNACSLTSHLFRLRPTSPDTMRLRGLAMKKRQESEQEPGNRNEMRDKERGQDNGQGRANPGENSEEQGLQGFFTRNHTLERLRENERSRLI